MSGRWLLVLLAAAPGLAAQQAPAPEAGPEARPPYPSTLPRAPSALRFAVIGNSGHGGRQLYLVGRQLARAQEALGFELVLLTGDNVDGTLSPAEVREKFEDPYADLLDSGVRFFAVLGNHDDPRERYYHAFNMGGRRYYSFTPAGASLRFFALESSYLDQKQLAWLEQELSQSREDWKLVVLHHALYSSDAGSAERTLRRTLEPLLEKHGVQAVFSGHHHAYERVLAKDGIEHFTSGAAGEARQHRGKGPMDARFDAEASFLVCELGPDRLSFEAVSAGGRVVDAGQLRRPATAAAAPRQGSR